MIDSSEAAADFALCTGELAGWVGRLRSLEGGDDATCIDQLRHLEEIKSAAAAAQARITARFVDSQRAAQEAAGTPARERGKGLAAQVALARRDSPALGARHVGLAEALVREMPHTMAAFEAGQVSEWRATLVVRESACLSRADRASLDAELAARPGGLASLGTRAIIDEARRIAYRLDPHAFTKRARRAEQDRRVTVRPAPDTMSLVTGLLPARQGVAVYAALKKRADSLRAQGDPRTRGQIMADTMVERVTGQATADEAATEIALVISDRTLVGVDDDPAELSGYGPLPAPLVRGWLRDLPDDVATWVRRLYAGPAGQLVAMESRRRVFAGGQRRLVVYRDRSCRTAWCDAPIRHIDHPVPFARGGPTRLTESQGLCEACNYAKEAPGWRAHVAGDGAVETTTPTGHLYRTRPPPTHARGTPPSRAEFHFANFVLAV